MNVSILLAYMAAFFAAALALVAVCQRQRSMSSWLLAGGFAVLSSDSLFAALAADSLQPSDVVSWSQWRLVTMALLPLLWFLFTLTYSRGNARDFLKKWRWIIGAFAAVPLCLIAYPSALIPSVARPINGLRWIINLGPTAIFLQVIIVVVAILILTNLERTFRVSVGTIRWRIKFMLIGVAAIWTVRGYTSTQVILSHSITLSLVALDALGILLGSFLIARSLFRSDQFVVNLYPSQSVLHNSMTVLLGGIYLLMIGLLAKGTHLLQTTFALDLRSLLLLISFVVLATVLLSEKLRRHVKSLVSRHFHRPLYDYRNVWRAFADSTAQCQDERKLSEAVARMLSELFQAMSVTVWLVDERTKGLAFAASTSLSRTAGEQLHLDPADLDVVLNGLASHSDPLDIDSSKEIWAILLRRLHPDEFRTGGNRIGVPLSAGGQLLGFITLGDRVGGLTYWPQDFELLKTIGEQTAGCLLNIQLSQKAVQNKQIEAFQAMSTFFVHDLKNTASTFSLMLQNLPTHFHDPAFREDALRAVSRTVTHINDLIARLSALRRELATQPVESDLNELVTEALQRVQSPPRIELIKDLQPLPKLRLDRGQIQTVLTNLVLNAHDAMASGGQIRVETRRRNGWAVLAVADSGCGMTSDFVQHSLFRPFQTTKQKGIGIGMFQCKTIVEAHHGRIEVETEPGKGTSFHVLLPVT